VAFAKLDLNGLLDADRLKKAKRTYPTPALEKGLDILELFAREPGGLNKSEVARSLDRTVSEIFRMLLCLEERGYIARSEEDERFYLTLKVLRMAMEYPPVKRLASEALPVMQDIVHKLNQSCHLGVLENGQVVIIAQADSPVSPGFYVKAGSVVDLMHAATGHVILAHLPQEQRDRAVARWQQKTGNRVPKDLDEHLKNIQARGYEERESYQIRGVINISYPVLDENNQAIAALTVPYLARMEESMPLKQVRAVLAEGSLKLSEAIGGAPHSATRAKIRPE
jgi:DNA-binding IclR family transcriptional regulator